MTQTTIPSVDDYRSADRSGKSNMRSMARNAIDAAVDALDLETATAWRNAMRAWSESNTRSTVERDYGSAVADRIATFHAAIVALRDGMVRPSDVPDEIELSFDSDGTADVASAVAMASAPLFRSTKSDMRGAIAESVMDRMTPGAFYTMTEIAHLVEKYAPAYADRRASVGAVTNAIRNGIDGITYGHNGTASGGTRES